MLNILKNTNFTDFGLFIVVFLLGGLATIGLLIYLNQPTYIDLPDEVSKTDGTGTNNTGSQTTFGAMQTVTTRAEPFNPEAAVQTTGDKHPDANVQTDEYLLYEEFKNFISKTRSSYKVFIELKTLLKQNLHIALSKFFKNINFDMEATILLQFKFKTNIFISISYIQKANLKDSKKTVKIFKILINISLK